MQFKDMNIDEAPPVPNAAIMPRILRLDEAIAYVGFKPVLRELEKRAGLKPLLQQHKLTVYDRADIDAAIERIKLLAKPNQ